MLVEEMCQIRNQILDNRHVWQWINLNGRTEICERLSTRQRVGAVNIHRARPANPFSAGAPKGQCRVNLVFDLDQCVQQHRAAGRSINGVFVNPGLGLIIGIPAISLKRQRLLHASPVIMAVTFCNPCVLGKSKLGHNGQYTLALGGMLSTSDIPGSNVTGRYESSIASSLVQASV